MLHGTLPRAYLSPGLNYFGGYYGEDLHPPYPGNAPYISLDDPYSRLEDHRILQSPWEAASLRSTSPSPLDLSLKPSVTSLASSTASSLPEEASPRNEDCEAIEVDDEEDRKDRVQKRLGCKQTIRMDEDESTMEDIDLSQRSLDIMKSDSLALTRLPYPVDAIIRPKYQFPAQKLLMSPSSLQSVPTYHQQLLMTPPQNHLHGIHAPMTPPSTPSPPQCTRRRAREDEVESPCGTSPTPKSTSTPTVEKVITKPRKKHVARRLKFDEDTSSPVSGTVILGPDEAVVTGDIDPAFNVVEVTDEARAELAKIENRLGPYQCKLCKQLYDDAFQLAQHRCSRIAHVEYRCPECDKRFSCPANLASHRRWHKPRVTGRENGNATHATLTSSTSSSSSPGEVSCSKCDAKFTRQTALRKHLASQHAETNNNDNSNVNNNIDVANEAMMSPSNDVAMAKAMLGNGTRIQQLVSGTMANEVA